MVDIMALIEVILGFITIGSFGPSWLPKLFGSHLHNYKFSQPEDYWAAVELIAEGSNKCREEVDTFIYELTCGKYGI